MAKSPQIRFDPRGARAVLNSPETAAATKAAAEAVADNVRSQNLTVANGAESLPVSVSLYKTDRAHATVTLAHPAGQAIQAKHGTLTKAAAAAGLDVRAK